VLQNPAGSGGSGVMVVHAELGPDGKVFAEEPSTNAEPSFTARALEAVKQMEFGPTGPAPGIIVRSTPEAVTRGRVPLPPLAATSVPIEPFYLSAEEKAILLRIVEEEGAEADKRYQK
jgi:hypothetical protein